MINKKLLCLTVTTWFLTSCATVPAPQAPVNQKQSWDTRVKTLSEVQSWDMKALISIKNLANNSNITANLQWAQKAGNYSIRMFGPLGAGALKLTGHPGGVKLEMADGKIFNASSPEALLLQQANMRLPVSSLYYWIRGLPVPGMPNQKTYDSYSHLSQLQQQNWQIQYLRYTSVNNIDVPNKIFIYNPELNVKIIINEWSF